MKKNRFLKNKDRTLLSSTSKISLKNSATWQTKASRIELACITRTVVFNLFFSRPIFVAKKLIGQ